MNNLNRRRLSCLIGVSMSGWGMVWAGPIRVGTISDSPSSQIKKFLPFADYLARQLRPEGIDKGSVVIAAAIPEMAALLREGKVDFFIDSAYPALAAKHLSGSKFLLRRWKKGVGEYHPVIFTRSENSIAQLSELNGKIIALEEAYSSSGYFFPKLALLRSGLKPVLKKAATDSVRPAEVGYVFSNDDETTMIWVLRGMVAAGAMDTQNYKKEARARLNELKIVHQLPGLPRQILSHRADLDERLAGRIKQILLAMDQTDEGKKVLAAFEQTARFDELPTAAIADLNKAAPYVAAELGSK